MIRFLAWTWPVPTLPMFHPAFLLRSPERKREAWRDLLALKARLDVGRIVPELVDKAEAEGELSGLSFIADPLK